MSHEITIAQAAERACQAETICRLIESYPQQLQESEIASLASLLQRLSGDAAAWMMEEMAQREGNHD